MGKLILCTGLLILAACGYRMDGLGYMGLSGQYPEEPEFKGEIQELPYQYVQQIRDVKDANIEWHYFSKVPNDIQYIKLTGNYEINDNEGVFLEKITSKKLTKKRHYKGKYNDTPELYKNKNIVGIKTHNGHLLAVSLVDIANNETSSASSVYKLKDFYGSTTVSLYGVELKKDEYIEFPITKNGLPDGKKIGDFIFAVSGQVHWKNRPSILVEIRAKYKTYSLRDVRDYNVKSKGYSIIDMYSGITVFSDVVTELDNEANALMYERSILNIELDPSTPILTDQFVLNKEKAAQL